MIKFIKKYNLELMSVILLVFILTGLFNWGDFSWQRHMVTIYMIFLTMHEWEENRFPGGFAEMRMASTNNGVVPDVDMRAIHIYTACLVLLVLLPGWIFDSVRPFLMMPVCLGCIEGLSHTLSIFMFHQKIPYTPGMCTGILMFITSVYTLITGFRSGTITVSSLLIGLVIMVVLFLVFRQFTVKATEAAS